MFMRTLVSYLFITLLAVSTVFGQTTIFFDDFETGTLGPAWVANPGPTDGLAAVVSASSFSGAFHLRLGKTTDFGGSNTAYADLTVDLSAYVDSQLEFSFAIYDYYDEDQLGVDGIFVSDDGGASFTPLIPLTSNAWTNTLWGRRYPYDLDEMLSGIFGSVPDTIVFRFQQRGTGNFSKQGDEDGIALDNVLIRTERPINYTTVPYCTDFESGAFDPEWLPNSRRAAGTTGPNALSRFPYSRVTNSASWAYNGSHSLWMGKTQDAEGYNLNAVDLYLDMGTYVDSQLSLSFFSGDFYGETSAFDGIYASGDHGVTFEKIIDFDPTAWHNLTNGPVYGQRVPYDLDRLLIDNLSCGCVPDTLVLRFQQYDNANFGTTGEVDGIFIDQFCISVDPTIVPATVPYCEDFESGSYNPEWKVSSREAAGTTGPNVLTRFSVNRVGSSVTWANSGTHSIRMGKSSDFEGGNTNATDLYLTMGTYADSQLTMSFAITDFYDDTNPSDGIYASGDHGLSFHKIIDFNPTTWYNFNFNPYYGSRIPYDLDQLLIDNLPCECVPDTLILRFQQYGTGDFNTTGNEDGIFLDDVCINVDPTPIYASIPYFEDFETAVFEREWKINSERALTQSTLSSDPSQLNRFWRTQVANGSGLPSGSYFMRMSKTSDLEGNNLNALDLHVNMQGESQVELRYWIFKFFDEQQIDDGIFLSVDGGETFQRIHDFNLANIPNTTWVQQSLDLSALAAALPTPLVLSDSTVIRFQQSGTGNQNTSGDEDGLSFDNIEINCLGQTADFTFDVDCSTLQVDFTDVSQGTNITTPYAWDFDGDGIIDTVGNGDISFTYAGTGTYQVTLYVGNQDGCGDSITQQVFIGSSVPAPTLNVTGPTVDLCQGDSLTLSAAVGYQGYEWSNGATTPSIVVTTPGTYSVRGLGIDGCLSVPTEIEVLDRPSPLAPFLSIVGPTEFCSGEDSVELIAPFGASQYLWSTGDTTQSIFATDSGRYEVRIANAFGCFSPPADTLITVLPTPPTPAINQNGNLLSSADPADSYAWFLDGVAVGPDSSSIDASLYGSGLYTLQLSNGPCVSPTSEPADVTVTHVAAAAGASAWKVYPNPASAQVTIEGDLSGSLSLRWSLVNALGQPVLSGDEDAQAGRYTFTLPVAALPAGLYHLRLISDTQVDHLPLRVIH